MFPQMPVLKWETAPTGIYNLALAYADCRSELAPLYDVEAETANTVVEERCGPLRKRLQDAIDGLTNTFGDHPHDGPVVVFIRALALMAIVRKGRLRFL
jgi:hypothetical protein